MATKSRRRAVKSSNERLIEYSLAVWSELPKVDAEIDSWPHDEQIDYLEDWGSNEATLSTLREKYAQGKMTPVEEAKFKELLDVVDKNRPIIKRLLAS